MRKEKPDNFPLRMVPIKSTIFLANYSHHSVPIMPVVIHVTSFIENVFQCPFNLLMYNFERCLNTRKKNFLPFLMTNIISNKMQPSPKLLRVEFSIKGNERYVYSSCKYIFSKYKFLDNSSKITFKESYFHCCISWYRLFLSLTHGPGFCMILIFIHFLPSVQFQSSTTNPILFFLWF